MTSPSKLCMFYRETTVKKSNFLPWMINMAIPVVEFSREGYKIRNIFG
jgi:hypothetical protein